MKSKRSKKTAEVNLEQILEKNEEIAEVDAGVGKVDEFLTDKIDDLFHFAVNRYPRVTPPINFRGSLFRYQEESLGWMLNRELYQKEILPSPTLDNLAKRWDIQVDYMLSKNDVAVENLYVMENYPEWAEDVKTPMIIEEIQPLHSELLPINASVKGGILADEMGLGKTIQMLALIATNKPQGNSYGTLIVVPLSLLQQWSAEAQKMIQNVHLYVLHGTNKNLENLHNYDIVFTTYKTLLNLMQDRKFASIVWWRIILDEAHEIRNAESQTAAACFQVEAQHRWALTGTPVQNKWRDLYSLFHFLRVRPYGEFEGWLKLIEFPLREEKEYVELKANAEITLRNLIHRLVMRRTKNQKLGETPQLEMNSMVSDQNDRVYRVKQLNFNSMDVSPLNNPNFKETWNYSHPFEILDTLVHIPPKNIRYVPFEIPDMEAYQNVNLPKSYLLLLRLRQLSIDPLIYETSLDLIKNENDQVEEKEESETSKRKKIKLEQKDKETRLVFFCKNLKVISPKFKYVAEQLIEQESAHPEIKFIVFSNFTAVLDLLEVVLEQYGWVNAAYNKWQCRGPTNEPPPRNALKYVRIDGSVTTEDRARFVEMFESDRNQSIKLMLMSLKAGGVGLNLSRASKVYFMEPYFNPGAMNQAIDRVHRIGQVREVNVEILVSRGSVEEKIIGLLDYKTRLANASLSNFVKPGKEILNQILE